MSHVADVNLHITDLDALETAVREAGGELHRDQRTHRWYGRSVGGATSTRDPRTFGKCEHAISFPGIQYQIGVVKHPSGTGFDLAYDNWGNDGQHDGQRLEKKIGGPEAPVLRQGYASAVVRRELSRKGYKVSVTRRADGTVRVEAEKATSRGVTGR